MEKDDGRAQDAEKMHELAQELLRRSHARNLEWQESGYPNSYRVFFPDVALTISRGPEIREASDTQVIDYATCQLDLVGEAGKTVGTLLTKSRFSGESESPEEEAMHRVLAEIFDLAVNHVQGRNIDKALEYLRRE